MPTARRISTLGLQFVGLDHEECPARHPPPDPERLRFVGGEGGYCRGDTTLTAESGVLEGGTQGDVSVVPDLCVETQCEIGFKIHNLVLLGSDWDELTIVTGTELASNWGNTIYDQYTPVSAQDASQTHLGAVDAVRAPASVMWWSNKAGDYSRWSYHIASEACAPLTVVDTAPGSGSIALLPSDSSPTCIAWRLEASGRDAVTLSFSGASLAPGAVLKLFAGTDRNGRPLARFAGAEGTAPAPGAVFVGDGALFLFAYVPGPGSSFSAAWSTGPPRPAPPRPAPPRPTRPLTVRAAGGSGLHGDAGAGRGAGGAERGTGGAGGRGVRAVLPVAGGGGGGQAIAVQLLALDLMAAGFLKVTDPSRAPGARVLAGASSRRLPADPALGAAAQRLPAAVTAGDELLLELFPASLAFDAAVALRLALAPAPLAACAGPATLTAPAGTIHSTPTGVAYAPGAACEWVIDPPGPYDVLLLSFSSFESVHGKDTLSVWAGTALDAPGAELLAGYSGLALPFALATPPGVRGMALRFAADPGPRVGDAYPYTGIVAQYRAVACAARSFTGARGRAELAGAAAEAACTVWTVAPEAAGPFALALLSLSGDELDRVRLFEGAGRDEAALVATFRGSLDPREARPSTFLSRSGAPFTLELLRSPGRPAPALALAWGPADCIAGADAPPGPGAVFRGAAGAGDPFAVRALPGSGPAADPAFPLLRCTWRLAPGGGAPAAVRVTVARFEGAPGRDFLSLYDGPPPSAAGGLLMAALTGPAAGLAYTSTSSSVYLSYVATSGAALAGPVPSFAVAYETAGGGALCAGEAALTADAGTLSDGAAGGTYVNGMACAWRIAPAAAAGSIVLRFSRLELGPGDTVTVHDGADAGAPLLGELAGAGAGPLELRSSGPALYVAFASDGEGVGPGFEAAYARETGFCGPAPVPLAAPAAPSVTAAFAPPAPAAACAWLLDQRAAGYDSVWLTLPALAAALAPGDTLAVHDGPDAAAPVLLRAESGYPGGTVKGSGAALAVTFASGASNANPLAGASYRSVTCPRGGCSGHGACVRGECQCEAGFYGENCAVTEAGWKCGHARWADGVCDCGCGALDPDCAALPSFPAAAAAALRAGDCTGAGAAYPGSGVCGFCPMPAALAEGEGRRAVYVAPGGSDAGGDGSFARPYATLLRAARGVAAGTSIALLPGRYEGPGFCGGPDGDVLGNTTTPYEISVVGLRGRDYTAIDCASAGAPTAFVNSFARGIRIRGITWLNGAAPAGAYAVPGCLLFNPRGWDLAGRDARLTVAVEESRFVGCSGPGGALRVRLARRVLLRDVEFRRNRRLGTPEDCPLRNPAYGPENAFLSCNTYSPGAVIAGGGAVQVVYSGEVRVEGCLFADNFAELPAGSPPLAGSYYVLGGGALHVEVAELVSIDGSSFLRNANGLGAGGGALAPGTPGGGGALSVKRAELLVLRGTRFVNNSAGLGHGGGAWVVDGTSGSLAGLTFEGNAALLGGALSFGGFPSRDAAGLATIRPAALHLFASTFARSSAAAPDGSGTGAGGAIYAGDASARVSLSLEDVAATDSRADRGGFLYAAAPTAVTARRLAINGAWGAQGGGALYLAGAVAHGGFAAVTDCAPAGASAATVPSPLAGGTAHVLLTRVALEGSAATGAGGAVALAGRCALRVENSSVHGASSDGPGGAIFVSSAALALAGAELHGCHSHSDGGAVAAEGDASVAAERSAFVGNGAVGYDSAGGALALAITSPGTRNALAACSFENNTATVSGGALSVTRSTRVAVTASSFRANAAAQGVRPRLSPAPRLAPSAGGGAGGDLGAARGGGDARGDGGGRQPGRAARRGAALRRRRGGERDGATLAGNAAGDRGGAVSAAGACAFAAAASRVAGNRVSDGRGGGAGAGVDVADAACVALVACTLEANVAAGDGGALRVATSCERSAVEGGAVSGNRAGGAGGGILLSSGGLRVALAAVAGNNATDGGGAHVSGGALRLRRWRGTRRGPAAAPSSSPTPPRPPLPRLRPAPCAALAGNAAGYGAGCGTEEKALRVALATGRPASGEAVAFAAELVDGYGARLLSDSGSAVKAFDAAALADLDGPAAPAAWNGTGAGEAALKGSVVAATVRGVATFDALVVISRPGSSPRITFVLQAAGRAALRAAVEVPLRGCVVGEVQLPLSSVCTWCPPGSYSLLDNALKDATECRPCPRGGACFGGDLLRPAEGYWQSSYNATTFIKCLNGQCLAPAVGVPNAAALARNHTPCAEGFGGPLCTVCQEGYGRRGDYDCVKCPDPATNRGMGALMAFIICVVAGFMIWSNLSSSSRVRLSETSVLVKIVMDYLQIITLAKNFEIPWTFSMQFFFDVQRAASSPVDSVFSVDCIMSFEGGAMHPFYARLVFILLLPIFVSIFPGLVFLPWGAYRLLSQRHAPLPAPAARVAPLPAPASAPTRPKAAPGEGDPEGEGAAKAGAGARGVGVRRTLSLQLDLAALQAKQPAGRRGSAGAVQYRAGVPVEEATGAADPAPLELASRPRDDEEEEEEEAAAVKGAAGRAGKPRGISFHAGAGPSRSPSPPASLAPTIVSRAGVAPVELPGADPVAHRPLRLALDYWVSAALVTIFLVYPTVTQQLFRMFGCIDVGNGTLVLKREMSIGCASAGYRLWLLAVTVPCLLAFGLGLPVAVFLLLLRNKHRVRELAFRRKFSFLFKGYRRERLYWETVSLVRKLVIGFVVVFFEGRQLIQSLLGFGVLVFFFSMNLVMKPWETRRLNLVDNLALFASTTTIYSGIFLTGPDLTEADTMAVTVCLLGLNLAFLAMVAFVVLRNLAASGAAAAATFRARLAADPAWSRPAEGPAAAATFRRVGLLAKHAYGALTARHGGEEGEDSEAGSPRAGPGRLPVGGASPLNAAGAVGFGKMAEAILAKGAAPDEQPEGLAPRPPAAPPAPPPPSPRARGRGGPAGRPACSPPHGGRLLALLLLRLAGAQQPPLQRPAHPPRLRRPLPAPRPAPAGVRGRARSVAGLEGLEGVGGLEPEFEVLGAAAPPPRGPVPAAVEAALLRAMLRAPAPPPLPPAWACPGPRRPRPPRRGTAGPGRLAAGRRAGDPRADPLGPHPALRAVLGRYTWIP
eukprot:tig00001214_g7548.t1